MLFVFYASVCCILFGHMVLPWPNKRNQSINYKNIKFKKYKLIFLCKKSKVFLNRCIKRNLPYVPEVLNVHMNEIYKKLTTIEFKNFLLN